VNGRIDAASCRDHVARHFSVERMGREYEQLYEDCAGPESLAAVQQPLAGSRE
jgi:hypothetical protein